MQQPNPVVPANRFKLFRSERFRRLSKEGFWIVLGQMLAMAGSLAGVRMMTELMSPVAYGRLALGMTVATLVGQTVFGPLVSGITRYYAPAVEAGDLGGYLAGVRRLVGMASCIIVLMILLAIPALLLTRQKALIGIAAASILFAILTGYNSIINGIQNAARQRAIVALHQGLESWLRFLVVAGLLLWVAATSSAAMVGSALGVALVIGSQLVYFRKIIPVKLPQTGDGSAWFKCILKYSWPIAVTGIMSWGFFASQRWALQLFTSTVEVGYFSAIFQIGFTPFTLAGGILMTLIMPIIFIRAGDGGDRQKMNLVAKPIITFCLVASLLVLVATAIGAVSHDLVFRLLVAQKYRSVSHYLPYAIFSAGMFQVSLFLSTIILASTKTKMLLPINTFGNLLIAGLNLYFTYRYGMGGLFFAMAIGSLIHLLWNAYNVYEVSRNV